MTMGILIAVCSTLGGERRGESSRMSGAVQRSYQLSSDSHSYREA